MSTRVSNVSIGVDVALIAMGTIRVDTLESRYGLVSSSNKIKDNERNEDNDDISSNSDA